MLRAHSRRRRLLAAAAIAFAGTVARSARADSVLLESAQLGDVGRLGGTSLSVAQHVGWRFELAEPLAVEQVGGHLLSYPDVSGNLFAALVRLPALDTFPHGSPLAEDEVVATTTFRANFPSGEILTPLETILAPGAYALVFGTGQFGATGEGAIHNGPDQPDIPPTDISSYIFWGIAFPGQPPLWRTNLASHMRFVIAGRTLEPADFNEDGAVDGADLSLWTSGFGALAGAARSDGEATGDGAVDGADLLAWQKQFGTPATVATGVAPEPTGAALGGLASLMVGRRLLRLSPARR